MPNYNEAIQENILNGLVEIIISNKLDVLRICNFVSAQNRNFYYRDAGKIKPHDVLIGKCFADILCLLQETLKDSVVPRGMLPVKLNRIGKLFAMLRNKIDIAESKPIAGNLQGIRIEPHALLQKICFSFTNSLQQKS